MLILLVLKKFLFLFDDLLNDGANASDPWTLEMAKYTRKTILCPHMVAEISLRLKRKKEMQ